MTKKNIQVYSEDEIKKKINESLKDWKYDGKWIRKVYKTHSWKSTLMVVNTIGHIAEVGWHHPDLVVSYAFVEVKLMTHSHKGITDLDFEIAKKIEETILWDPKETNNSLEGTPEDPRFAYIKNS